MFKKSFLLLMLVLSACFASKNTGHHGPLIQLPGQETIEVSLAISDKEQQKGLSGLSSDAFGPKQGMLFYYQEDGERRFWMPDTYFDLDIFFLSQDLVVVDVSRDMAHHPGWKSPPEIAQTPPVVCRHVLELRSDSPLAKKIVIGSKLKWIYDVPLSEIKSSTRRLQ